MRAWRFALLMFLLASRPALASMVLSETFDGDISDDRLNPTFIDVFAGSSILSGTLEGEDLDYFTITVPEGMQLFGIVVKSYQSTDSSGMIAMMAGSTFSEPTKQINYANLMGWSKFGNATLGTDILDNIGAGAGTAGFTGPVTEGDYSFWVQQSSGILTNYTFEFLIGAAPAGEVVPEASSLAMLAAVAATGVAARTWRRRSRRAAA